MVMPMIMHEKNHTQKGATRFYISIRAVKVTQWNILHFSLNISYKINLQTAEKYSASYFILRQ